MAAVDDDTSFERDIIDSIPKGADDGWGGGKSYGGKKGKATAMNERQNRIFVTRIGEELTKDDLEA